MQVDSPGSEHEGIWGHPACCLFFACHPDTLHHASLPSAREPGWAEVDRHLVKLNARSAVGAGRLENTHPVFRWSQSISAASGSSIWFSELLTSDSECTKKVFTEQCPLSTPLKEYT